MKLRLFLIINSIALLGGLSHASDRRRPVYSSASQCEGVLLSPESTGEDAPKITFGRGSDAEEVSRSAVGAQDEAIIWLKSDFGWAARWNTHDLAGDSRWGYRLLGDQAATAGFGRRTNSSGKEEYSIPTIAHQNQVLKNLRPEIASQIKTRPKNLTGRDYLSALARGVVFADTQSSRAYLHHINYHFVSLLLMKQEALSAFKRRSALLLEFAERVSLRHDKKFDEDMEKVLDEAAGRLDMASEIAPLLAAVQSGDLEGAAVLAAGLRSALGSVSDSIFIASVFQTVAQTLPKGHSLFIPTLRRDLEYFKELGRTIERDAALVELGDSLRAFSQTRSIDEIKHWRR